MESEGRKIHNQAAIAREQGNHLDALKLQDEAMLTYQRDGDLLGLAEILADRSIVLRHLFEETDDKSWLFIAKAEMEASVEIAKESGDKTATALPLFNLAKVNEAVGDYQQAVRTYEEAIANMEANPPASHNRSAVLSDMKIHLNYAQYKSGDKSALEKMQENIKELENSDEPEISQYNYDVWLSGAYMSMAEMLKEDNPDEAKSNLEKAKIIIDSSPDLKIRLAQWGKLAAAFN
jgi:tetratricopeptide (TPR) repeat protein